MSQHGRATIDSRNPRALGVCDRCGTLYNHHQLRWQSDWRGPRIQNLQLLVCEGCYDGLQASGQRTIRLSADPLPIRDAVAEDYVADSQPLSGIGGSPDQSRWQYGSVIGSMTEGGGPQAAFDGNPAKPSFMAAVTSRSNSSFNNYVGVNWGGLLTAVTPSSIGAWPLTHTLSEYVLKAPVDSTFGSTGFVIQGSHFGDPRYFAWTTLASGTFTGTVGEQSSGRPSVGSGRYQFHRVAFFGNDGGAIAVAQVAFTVSDGSSNAQGV
jgi:hypothetical protein